MLSAGLWAKTTLNLFLTECDDLWSKTTLSKSSFTNILGDCNARSSSLCWDVKPTTEGALLEALISLHRFH